MMFWKLTYLPLKKASGFLFAACVAWGSVCSCALADDYTNCIPNKQNGQYTLECPSGSTTRNDIDANCLKTQNQNSCINTMPVSGSVSRIPEDVCYRGEGWSNKRNHNGIDYAVPVGTPVTAAADGVAQVNKCVSGGGMTVVIVHKKATSPQSDGVSLTNNSNSDYYTSIYMHLSEILVGNGAQVKKGQVIAKSGDTNCSGGQIKTGAYGAHLHFEMRDGNGGIASGNVLDPLCNEIQSLCETQSSNIFYQNSSDYDAFQCRNCSANANGCRKTETGGYDHNGDPINPTDNNSSTSTASSGDCAKMYNENNLIALSAAGESGGDAGITNKCLAADNGGCSYGRNQMACGAETAEKQSDGKFGVFYQFMQNLSTNHPDLFQVLSNGNDLDTTVKYACNNKSYPAENQAFQEAWASLGDNAEFGAAQDEIIYNEYVVYPKKACGSEWDKLMPEVQMTLMACAIASPKTVQSVIKQIQQENPNTALSDIPVEDIIPRINHLRTEIGYASYKTDPAKRKIYDSLVARESKDNERALTSAKIRQAINDPANAGRDPNEVALEVTGKRLCAEDEYPGYSTGSWSNDPSANAAAALSGESDEDCRVSKYRNSFKDCLFCNIFKVLFNTASTMAKSAYETLSDSALTLLLVGTALWLGLTIMRYVSSFNAANPWNMSKEIANKLFVVLCCVAILVVMDSKSFTELVIEPIFQTGLDLAKIAIANSTGATCNTASTAGILADGGLPQSMGESILCIIDAIQNKVLDIMAVGSSSICVGVYIESWHQIPLLPHFGYFLTGIVLWVASFLILVIYPWVLVDSLLNLCLAVVFLPFAIAGYPYKPTRAMFVGKVWGAFMNALFMFVFQTIVVAIILMALDNITAEAFNRSLTSAGDDGNAFQIILDSLAWWSMNFLKLVFILFLGWTVLKQVNTFASQFASAVKGGGGISVKSSIGPGVGTLAMSGVKGMGLKALGKGVSVADSGWQSAKEKWQDMRLDSNKSHVASRQEQIQNKGTQNADGSTSYTNIFGRKFTATDNGYSYKNWRGKTVTKTVNRGDNGNSVYTTTKTNKDGSQTIISKDGYIKQEVLLDKNGKEVSRVTSRTTVGGRAMLNKDGSVNQVIFNNIMQNSALSENDKKIAILEQLLRERMPISQTKIGGQPFDSRQIQKGVDENGREYFRIVQQNKNGEKITASMTFGHNGRVLTEMEQVRQDGQAVKRSSDGIFNSIQTYAYQSDGMIDEASRQTKFSATDYYTQHFGNVVDSNGMVARGVPVNDSFYSAEDLQKFGQQVARNGSPAPLSGFN